MTKEHAEDRGTVIQVPTSNDHLIVVAEYSHIVPELLYSYWTEPELLTKWWPDEAETDLREGGDFHLSWPKMDWHLRGNYDRLEPGKHILFTWQWDHEPDVVTRYVSVLFQGLDAWSTLLTVVHGNYA